jgi:hypothetical protein
VPKLIDRKTRDEYRHLRWTLGLRQSEAVREMNGRVSASWAKGDDKGFVNAGVTYQDRKADRGVPEVPVEVEELCPEAARSLEDFGLFRRRYFGRIASPWQEEAANRVIELLASPNKEFVVVNCPPGSGKSTLFTHDIPAWQTARDRSLRGLIGSRTQRQASAYTARLRQTFVRRSPVQAKDEERRKGYALDAVGVLAVDFGAFRPESPEIWTREGFTVAQRGDTPSDEKESTWTAFGMDAGSLGWRVNEGVWDDLVDKSVIRTAESIENQRMWWEDEGETRIEPDGLMILQGQRMSSVDLYRYALDMVAGDLEEWELEEEPDALPRKYHHIVYKAHYDELCTGVHRPGEARPYPDGCLLDPVRLSWRELRAIKANRAAKFEVLYQQQDVDPSNVLVPKLWVDGGTDPVSHEVFPGCWDKDRGLCELPDGVTGPLLSVATADPSPTKFWSVQWWNVLRNLEAAPGEDVSGLRYLMDLIRQSMDAPDFLDWNHSSKSFSGVMEEWQQRSVELGRPIQVWIVEANAAQRFMLQYDHVRRWCAARGVRLVAHQTHRNKTDPDYGVQMLAWPWRRGLVRLPGKQGDPGRPAALKLVDEVTRWPDGQYDDCVMGEWFLEHNLARLWATPVDAQPRLWRPRWARRGVAA